MTLARATVRNAAVGVAVADRPEDLTAFLKPGCAAALWPEQPASGLLHRSPPIEGTGETRLVLVLDGVMDLDDAE